MRSPRLAGAAPQRSRAACLVAIGLCLAGCGGGGRPAGHKKISAAARAVARAEATHEYPSPAPPPERAPGELSPVQAITAFARLYINWNAQDVSAEMTRLVRASVGQARSEMRLAAAETRADSTLRQGGIANRGEVEAVAPLYGRPDQYVVVTREATTASATGAYRGLAPAWHVTLAAVRELGAPQVGRRWAVSVWQPES